MFHTGAPWFVVQCMLSWAEDGLNCTPTCAVSVRMDAPLASWRRLERPERAHGSCSRSTGTWQLVSGTVQKRSPSEHATRECIYMLACCCWRVHEPAGCAKPLVRLPRRRPRCQHSRVDFKRHADIGHEHTLSGSMATAAAVNKPVRASRVYLSDSRAKFKLQKQKRAPSDTVTSPKQAPVVEGNHSAERCAGVMVWVPHQRSGVTMQPPRHRTFGGSHLKGTLTQAINGRLLPSFRLSSQLSEGFHCLQADFECSSAACGLIIIASANDRRSDWQMLQIFRMLLSDQMCAARQATPGRCLHASHLCSRL